MANRNDPPKHSNDPATTSKGGPTLPRQSEVNRSRGRTGEAVSRQRAARSGRSAAKWLGILLAVLVLLFVIAGIFGGGAWIWGPTPDEPAAEEVG